MCHGVWPVDVSRYVLQVFHVFCTPPRTEDADSCSDDDPYERNLLVYVSWPVSVLSHAKNLHPAQSLRLWTSGRQEAEGDARYEDQAHCMHLT